MGFSLIPLTAQDNHPASPEAPAVTRNTTFSADFLDTLAPGDAKPIRLTLPTGQSVIGTADTVKRDEANHVTKLSGTLQHPEPGDFDFRRGTGKDGAVSLNGSLRFTSTSTVWNIQAAGKPGRFGFVAAPADDAFRPRNMVLPSQVPKGAATPSEARDAAEDQLRKSLKIEQPAPGRLRIGVVEIHKDTRSVTFPATMNQREGVVEYAVVTRTGKTHESLFTTAAAPKDVHLALLLLGVKPQPCPAEPTQGAEVPAAAAAKITVEWDQNGSGQTHNLSELVGVRPDGASAPPKPLDIRLWQCTGSKFNRAGFAAELEGSIISLITDDLALINNPASDRANDDSHFPNTASLPPVGTTVTIRISPPLPASLPNKPDTP
ncbi:MAG: hypothetical protein J0M04_22195 [Verrucomicrobia bacterium]|nr:hypothetical protein [Verrucomicrobiota bacterium]